MASHRGSVNGFCGGAASVNISVLQTKWRHLFGPPNSPPPRHVDSHGVGDADKQTRQSVLGDGRGKCLPDTLSITFSLSSPGALTGLIKNVAPDCHSVSVPVDQRGGETHRFVARCVDCLPELQGI